MSRIHGFSSRVHKISFIAGLLVVVVAGLLVARSIGRYDRYSTMTVDRLSERYRLNPAHSSPDTGAVVESRHTVRNDRDVWVGKASWYDYTFDKGSDLGRVCNRVKEDCWTEDRYVAASRDFPRGTGLFVTNTGNGRQIFVIVTDYGPDESVFPDRIIDLSSHAFSSIASLDEGVISVEVWPLVPKDRNLH